MKTARTSRLNGEYQKEISEIIRHLKDRAPDLKGLVSVTEADVAVWAPVVIFVIPLAFLVWGFVIWFKRRKK